MRPADTSMLVLGLSRLRLTSCKPLLYLLLFEDYTGFVRFDARHDVSNGVEGKEGDGG